MAKSTITTVVGVRMPNELVHKVKVRAASASMSVNEYINWVLDMHFHLYNRVDEAKVKLEVVGNLPQAIEAKEDVSVDDELLGTKEAHKEIGISLRTLQEWIKAGLVNVVKEPNPKFPTKWVSKIARSEVDRLKVKRGAIRARRRSRKLG